MSCPGEFERYFIVTIGDEIYPFLVGGCEKSVIYIILIISPKSWVMFSTFEGGHLHQEKVLADHPI